jgi:hypothetical protein
LRRMPGRCRHDRCLPSWGHVLSRRLCSMPVARHGFRAAPLPRDSPTTVSGNLRCGPVGPFPGRAGLSRHRLPPAFRRAVRPQSSRPLQGIADALATRLPQRTAGLERAQGLPGFIPLQHIRTGAFTHIARVCLTRLRSAFRVSYPPDGFPRSCPSRLVSSRKRSWGCDPSELCSSRGAVAPLGARCPPVVSIASPSRCLPERRHAPNHGSFAQVRPAGLREPGCFGFRALLPSGVRSHPAVV